MNLITRYTHKCSNICHTIQGSKLKYQQTIDHWIRKPDNSYDWVSSIMKKRGSVKLRKELKGIYAA